MAKTHTDIAELFSDHRSHTTLGRLNMAMAAHATAAPGSQVNAQASIDLAPTKQTRSAGDKPAGTHIVLSGYSSCSTRERR